VNPWTWTGTWLSGSSLSIGWNTITVAVPTTSTSIGELGVEFTTNGSGVQRDFFMDSIAW
jgi:hypothetical protein